MATPVSNPSATQPRGPEQKILPTLFRDGYDIYATKPTTFLLSFLLHVLGIAMILLIGEFLYSNRVVIKQQVVALVGPDIGAYTLPPAKDQAGGGGGGGDRDKLQASKGNLPKLSDQQITPPTVIIRNDNPKLAVDPTVVVPPRIPVPTGGQLGDPMSKILGPLSNGTGSGSGIGSGSGGGVGSGTGPGVGPGQGGGIGGGYYRVGGGVSAPRALYSPDPEYSDEARKAKYQGTVVLWCVVGPDGRVKDVRISRALGMGLDEKAIEAVKQWKFEPARKDGQAVAVQINVEVNFHLY